MVKYKFKISFIILAVCLVSFSCEEFFLGHEAENTPENNFEIMWKEIDAYYPSFTVKYVNWSEVYSNMRPLVKPGTTNDELWIIMSHEIQFLDDIHVYIYDSQNNRIAESKGYFPDFEFNLGLVVSRYLNGSSTSGNGRFTYGRINNTTGYIHISNFDDQGDWSHNINNIVNELSDVESFILDVRDNTGGLLSNFTYIASRFAPRQITYAQEITRTGPKHDDLSQPVNMTIEPIDGESLLTKPIVVLTNKGTVSAGEMFALAIKSIPNATQIGSFTRGAVAYMTRYFVLPNGWVYRIPTSLILNLEGHDMENVGVQPDIYVKNTEEEIINGFDRQLEYCIQYLTKDLSKHK